MRSITNRELRDMRDEVEDSLPDVCNILELTSESDGAGSFTETWGTVRTNVPCRLDPFRPSGEMYAIDSTRNFSTWVLTFPWDISLTVANRVEIDALVYNVIDDAGVKRSWPVCGRALLTRVEWTI